LSFFSGLGGLVKVASRRAMRRAPAGSGRSAVAVLFALNFVVAGPASAPAEASTMGAGGQARMWGAVKTPPGPAN